jgi:hypothetical protein
MPAGFSRKKLFGKAYNDKWPKIVLELDKNSARSESEEQQYIIRKQFRDHRKKREKKIPHLVITNNGFSIQYTTVDVFDAEFSMNFLAQIDLASLPDFPERRALPREGTLYFFINSAPVYDTEPHGAVIYHPERAPEINQAPVPDDMVPINFGYSGELHPYCDYLPFEPDQGGERLKRLIPYDETLSIIPQWELKPHVMTTYNQHDNGPLPELIYEQRGFKRENQLQLLFGNRGQASPKFPPLFSPETTGAQSSLSWYEPEFPWNRGQIAGFVDCLVDGHGLGQHTSSLTGVGEWRTLAQSRNMPDEVDGKLRNSFREWIEDLYSGLDKDTFKAISDILNFIWLYDCHEAVRTGSPALKKVPDGIESQILANAHPGNGKMSGNIRMLGHPSSVQFSYETYQGWHLLFEVFADKYGGTGWIKGGVFQYWIHPDDLRQRNFDKVVVTAEFD